MPHIPDWTLAPAKSSVDTEIQRLKAHRASGKAEYKALAKATRRALHELEMATIDLRAAETRRIIVQAQAEKAKLGLLGVDYQTEV